MNTSDFQGLLALIRFLTRAQRELLTSVLRRGSKLNETTELLERANAEHLACPRCRSTNRHRHGRAHGLQRYRCIDCGKTYNSLTNTPMSWLHYRERWLEYSECLLCSYTVRDAAARVGVHKNTSFRWRHRFLSVPKMDRPTSLKGIAEADEMYLLESEKGARHLDRPPRKRGGAASQRGTSYEQVCVLISRDREGKTLDFIAGRGSISKTQLARCLLPVLDPEVLLVSDANAAYHAFARDAGITHRSVNLSKGIRVRGAIHVQNVNAYHSRFREWLERFHGVATSYLSNYLGWRWILDAKRINTPELLLQATVGCFPHFSRT